MQMPNGRWYPRHRPFGVPVGCARLGHEFRLVDGGLVGGRPAA